MNKIRKYEIYSVTLILFVSLFVLNSIYAQERNIEPVTNLTNEENLAEMTNTEQTDSVNADDSFENKAQNRNIGEEDVKFIAETVDEIRKQIESTETEIRDTVKTGIDRNIIEIKKQTDVQAFELQKSIDEDRLNLFENVSSTLQNINLVNSENLDNLINEAETRISNIERSLERESGLKTDFEQEKRSVRNTLLKLQSTILEKKDIIDSREGNKIYLDSDGDGVSDYDEEFIYNTDPNNRSTNGDDETDSEKILRGVNPNTNEPIQYSDPRDDVESYVTSAYKLQSVALVKEEGVEKIVFEGRALPNSFVTLYIYSTPIIVTVRTNENGDWAYELDKELENGEHQIYVATVNNSGKIIARSNPTTFTKTAEAASIGIVGIEVETSKAGDFFRDNFILIVLAILIVIVILALMITGREKTLGEVMNELKDEVKEKNTKDSTTDK